jgi:hypothetical protein
MASTIVVPTASAIGACAPEVATNLKAAGDPDARVANALIDVATAASADITALQAGSSIAVAVAGVSNGAMSATDKSNLDTAYARRTQIASQQVRATVTLTANAVSQVVNLDSALPANARIQWVNIKLATPASGGGATSCTAKIGSSGDDDAIVASANLFAAAVDGQCSSVTMGIAPNKHFASSTQLTATITSDVNVSALTALVVTFEVAYQVIA